MVRADDLDIPVFTITYDNFFILYYFDHSEKERQHRLMCLFTLLFAFRFSLFTF